MAVPITAAWIECVLEAINASRIRVTRDFTQQFLESFPGSTRGEVEDAFVKHFGVPGAEGCPVQMDSPPGETWEFFFNFKGWKTYGKITLFSDMKRVLFFSAHLPTKTKLRCDPKR